MKAKKIFFADSRVAGRKYYDCDLVMDQLKVGSIVRLEHEENNAYDANAVQIIFNHEDEDFLLGYLPQGEQVEIAKLLQAGWTELFECRISKIDLTLHSEKQLSITIRINRKEKK